MTVKSEGFLVGNTGITEDNHLYLTSNEEALSFFRGKSLGSFDDYSVTRPDGQSLNAYQSGAIHVNMVYDDAIACDYIAFKNTNDTRWYFGKVLNREYVNERSTRLWFVIDWYATFCDKLKLGKSYIERTHVGDDDSKLYQLPEPIDGKRYQIFDSKSTSQFSTINDGYKTPVYQVLSTIDEDGKLNNFRVQNLSGVPFIGTIKESTDINTCLEFMKNMVTISMLPINIKNSMAQNITGFWVENQGVTGAEGEEFTISFPENKYKHKKTLYYYHNLIIKGYGGQQLTIGYDNSNKGSVTGRKFVISGPGGCASVSVNYGDWEGENGAGGRVNAISTPAWPEIPFSGRVPGSTVSIEVGKQSFELNEILAKQ